MEALITCSVMLESGDRLLLVQEADPGFYGKWNQPAGHLDPGESILDCACREALEETGYNVELTGLQAIYLYSDASTSRINFCFRARPCGDPGEHDPDEILATHWFTREELLQIPAEKLRHPLTSKRIQDWLNGKSSPLDIIVTAK